MLSNRQYSSADIIRIPFATAPVLVTTLLAISGLSSVVSTYLLATAMSRFVDTALRVFAGNESFDLLRLPLAMLIGVMLFSGVLGYLPPVLSTRITLLLKREIEPEILRRRASLAYEYIEDSDSWELIERISDRLVETFQNGLAATQTLLRSIVAIIAVSTLIATEVWWVALILTALSGMLIWIAIYSGHRNHTAETDAYQFELRYSYLSDSLLTNRAAVEERYVFGYSPIIARRYLGAFNKAHRIQMAVQLRMLLVQKCGTIILVAAVGFVLLPLARNVYANLLTPGLFIGIATSLFALIELLASSLSGAVEKMALCREYMDDLSEFVAFRTSPGACDIPDFNLELFRSIEFRNVSFKYPNSEQYALEGISFCLSRGLNYAFVGTNGAGKTTITKLLTGLYGDYCGSILLNDKELSTFPARVIKASFAVVHQDFARYEVSLRDNIELGAIQNQIDDRRLRDVIKKVSLSELVNRLSNGIDTHLGRLGSDSIDISGGEWQRLAIARAILSPAPIKILDEPTAALDPIAESRLYQEFEEVLGDNTTILISHRLGSTKLVDKIFVLDQGRIVEEGSHIELMMLNGLYSKMYRLQSEWYSQ